MKIFYFSGTKLPSQCAQSVHVMKMAQALGKAGHDLTLFAKGMNNAASEDIFNIYDIDPVFKLYLSSYLNVPVLSGASRLMTLAHRITKLEKPDLVYGHDPFSLAMLSPKDVPIIFEAHEMPSQSKQQWAFSKLIRQANLKAIVAVSDTLKQELLRKYHEIDAKDIFVAHDGADLIQDIAASEKNTNILKGRESALNIGYAGSLNPGKGIALISRIALIRPEYDFHILGGSKKQVQRLETHNTLKNLYFYGYRDHADVPAYLKAFDITVAPYQHRSLIRTGRNMSRWISPMKVFEYMAAEKPIICSNLSVIHEILQHQDNALLLPASDEHKWAQAMDMLKENPDEAERLAHNAYKSLKDKYTWDKRACAIMDNYLGKRPTLREYQA